jgi:hypothetical protein
MLQLFRGMLCIKMTEQELKKVIQEELESVLNEKAKKTVGAEISAQMDKGKPHEKAVAIALSKEERGEVRADEAMNEEELDERCQKGYKTHEKRKTKKMYGKTYRNCVKAEQLELDEKKKRKKKKKKKAKKLDRCARIAKRKYKVWPSAYASGAAVKCRQGKIWKGLKEEDEGEITPAEEKTIKKMIVKLRKSSKGHAKQSKQLGGASKLHAKQADELEDIIKEDE